MPTSSRGNSRYTECPLCKTSVPVSLLSVHLADCSDQSSWNNASCAFTPKNTHSPQPGHPWGKLVVSGTEANQQPRCKSYSSGYVNRFQDRRPPGLGAGRWRHSPTQDRWGPNLQHVARFVTDISCFSSLLSDYDRRVYFVGALSTNMKQVALTIASLPRDQAAVLAHMITVREFEESVDV